MAKVSFELYFFLLNSDEQLHHIIILSKKSLNFIDFKMREERLKNNGLQLFLKNLGRKMTT